MDPPVRGGFRGRGRGMGRGGRGRGMGRGGRGGRGGMGRDDFRKEWKPITKLGRLVSEKKITRLEDIFLSSNPIKEHQIVETLLGNALKDELMYVSRVQRASSAGQRTRTKAFVVVGDTNGHIGVGSRVAKEAQEAIQAASIAAKLNITPIRRGYWGNKIGQPHTVPAKVTGTSGSVSVRLVPAPRGTGIVAAPVPTKILQLAGIEDCYTSSKGCTKTRGNFIMATFYALRKTYGFLTPDLWPKTADSKEPADEHSEFLAQTRAATAI